MVQSNDFLDAIEAAYAAGLDAELWPAALHKLTRLFGAVGATLEDFGKQPFGLRNLHVVGLPSHAETAYLAQYQFHNPRAAYAFRNLSKPILCDYQLIDERAMDRDAFYEKYLGSLGVRYFLSGQVIDTPHAQAVVTIQRTRRQGHVGQREIELMQRVTPHLQRAYDVARRLRTAENASSTLERAFDWLADGVMLVTTAGEVTYANAAMQDIARRGDGLRIVKARLEFTDSKAANRYEAALGLIARLRDGSPDGIGGDFAVSRAGGAPPYIVSLRPLAQRKERDRDHNAVAILFIHDPLRKNAAAMHAFRESFGLTEAEAALAEALQGGAALADYARDRRLSLNTVYTHLRRVKEKTGCTRLPELIRKLTDVQIRVRPG